MQSGTGRCLIDQVNRLVGQIPIIDITTGQSHCRLHRFRCNGHMVMCFVLPLDTLQDADSLFLCGFFHRNRLESPLQCSILLNILAILRDRGRTDQLDLSAGQRRFHDIGRINSPFGTSGTDDRMQFIQE